jgi:hypothetical protein
MSGIEQKAMVCILRFAMPQPQELLKLKQRLSDLESLRLLSPHDLEIVATKRILRQKIFELKNNEALTSELAAAA